MTNNNHPITPPDELVEYWWQETQKVKPEHWVMYLATQAARWGADQELEACLGEIRDGAGRLYIDEFKLRVCLADDIWTARRKPPSLKEQALEALDEEHADMRIQNYKLIRFVLESLPD